MRGGLASDSAAIRRTVLRSKPVMRAISRWGRCSRISRVARLTMIGSGGLDIGANQFLGAWGYDAPEPIPRRALRWQRESRLEQQLLPAAVGGRDRLLADIAGFPRPEHPHVRHGRVFGLPFDPNAAHALPLTGDCRSAGAKEWV